MERTIQYVDIAFTDTDEMMNVGFYEPTDGQGAMLARAVSLASRGEHMNMRVIALILDVIDAMVVKEEDRLELNDAMVAGRLKLSEMIKVLEVMGEEKKKEQAPTKGPVAKKARASGRP